jgi:hypothetical protein
MMVIGILFSSGIALAADVNTDCSRLKADASVSTPAAGKEPWRGTAILSLGGEQIVGDLVAYQDLKSIVFFPDGSYEGREVAYFSSTSGNFEVEDYYRVEPTDTPGKLMFHAEGNIVTGDGRFQSTFGRMNIRGPIYPDGEGGATSYLKANGSVCRMSK